MNEGSQEMNSTFSTFLANQRKNWFLVVLLGILARQIIASYSVENLRVSFNPTFTSMETTSFAQILKESRERLQAPTLIPLSQQGYLYGPKTQTGRISAFHYEFTYTWTLPSLPSTAPCYKRISESSNSKSPVLKNIVIGNIKTQSSDKLQALVFQTEEGLIISYNAKLWMVSVWRYDAATSNKTQSVEDAFMPRSLDSSSYATASLVSTGEGFVALRQLKLNNTDTYFSNGLPYGIYAILWADNTVMNVIGLRTLNLAQSQFEITGNVTDFLHKIPTGLPTEENGITVPTKKILLGDAKVVYWYYITNQGEEFFLPSLRFKNLTQPGNNEVLPAYFMVPLL